MVFIIYKTDEWHTQQSRWMIAVSTGFIDDAIDLCKEQAKKEGHKLSPDSLFNLRNIKQTQEYEGDGQFVIEPVETNKLLTA